MIGLAIAGVSAAYSMYQSNEAGDAADAARAQQDLYNQKYMESLQEAKNQNTYWSQQWEAQYGPIQDSLADYYKNLSADSYNTQGQEALSQRYAQMGDQLQSNLALRGITDSGVNAEAQVRMATSHARDSAAMDIQSKEYVVQQQANFLAQSAQYENPYNSATQQSTLNQGQGYYNMAQQEAGNVQNYQSSAAGYASAAGKSLGYIQQNVGSYNDVNPNQTLIDQAGQSMIPSSWAGWQPQ